MKFSLSQQRPEKIAVLLILSYLFLIAPYSLQYIFYLPDERHYVDAAIYMIKHGGYFSPHDPNGGYRFLKPIFTYWVILGSYKIFGISQFSSRLPFLIAAGLVLWMSFKIAQLSFRDKRIAILALVMTASIPILNRAVATSLTDVYQLFFLQVMSYSVIGILQSPKQINRYLYLLYISAGLAVTVKGSVSIAFLSACLFFLLVNPWCRLSLKKILLPLPVLIFLVIGGFWFIITFFQHGPDALGHFYEDQIGYRVTSRVYMILKNFKYSLIVTFILLFPFMFPGWWSLFYKNNLQVLKQNKSLIPIFAFAVLWILFMITLSSLVSKFYYRYLIPISHIMALLFSFFIIQNEQRKGIKILLSFSQVLSFFLFGTMAIGSIISNYYLGQRWLPITLTILLLSFGIILFRGFGKQGIVAKSIRIFFYMIGIFTSLAMAGRPFSHPDQGQQIVASLHQNGITPESDIQYFGKTRIASRIRIASKGDFYFPALNTQENPAKADFIIFGDNYKDSLNLENYDIQQISAVWKKFPVSKIIKTKTEEELKQLQNQYAEKYFLATKNE